MTLSTDDAALFFTLLPSLMEYVRRKERMFEEAGGGKGYNGLTLTQQRDVRNVVLDKPELIDAFVAENPDQLSEEDLQIMSGWKSFVSGDFYIERHLARHTIFIQGDEVYAVLGLYQPIDEVIGRDLPVLARGLLLPFKGAIVYDGILESYPYHFGGGYRASLRDTYMKAKQRGKIRTSLDSAPPAGSTSKAKQARDWTPKIESLIKEVATLRAGPGAPVAQGSAFALVKAALDLALAASTEESNSKVLYDALLKADRALRKVIATVEREIG